MSSIIRSSLITVFSMTAVMSLRSLAFADDPAGVEHGRPAADQTVGVASLPRHSIETISGIVASIDERNDTIKIRRSPEISEELKVQDGLLFDAVRYGDLVEVTVENTNGAKTIVGLTKK